MRPEVEEALTAARALRAELELEPAESMECVIEVAEERLELEVVVAPLPDGVSGFYLPARRTPTVVIAGGQPVQRQRFTLAHEIGHHRLGHGARARVHATAPRETPASAGFADGVDQDVSPSGQDSDLTVSGDRIAAGPDLYATGRSTSEVERAANTFAAELLAPEDGARICQAAWTDPDPLDHAVRLSGHFGISALSAVVKLEMLGVIDRQGADALRDRLRAGEHLPRYEALDLKPLDDALQRHTDSGASIRASAKAAAVIRTLRGEAEALAVASTV